MMMDERETFDDDNDTIYHFHDDYQNDDDYDACRSYIVEWKKREG